MYNFSFHNVMQKRGEKLVKTHNFSWSRLLRKKEQTFKKIYKLYKWEEVCRLPGLKQD